MKKMINEIEKPVLNDIQLRMKGKIENGRVTDIEHEFQLQVVLWLNDNSLIYMPHKKFCSIIKFEKLELGAKTHIDGCPETIKKILYHIENKAFDSMKGVDTGVYNRLANIYFKKPAFLIDLIIQKRDSKYYAPTPFFLFYNRGIYYLI